MNIKKALYDIPINMMANRSINIAEFYRTAVIKINSSNFLMHESKSGFTADCMYDATSGFFFMKFIIISLTIWLSFI